MNIQSSGMNWADIMVFADYLTWSCEMLYIQWFHISFVVLLISSQIYKNKTHSVWVYNFKWTVKFVWCLENGMFCAINGLYLLSTIVVRPIEKSMIKHQIDFICLPTE